MRTDGQIWFQEFESITSCQYSISIPPEIVGKIRGNLMFLEIIKMEIWRKIGSKNHISK